MNIVSLLVVAITILLFLLMATVTFALVLRAAAFAMPGQATVVTTPKGAEVRDGLAVVIPVIHRAESVDLSAKLIALERRGGAGLLCADQVRLDIAMLAYLRVGHASDDILEVASSLGCAAAADPAMIRDLVEARLVETLKAVAATWRFEDIILDREAFRGALIATLGDDLQGFVLDDLVLTYLDQTPVHLLDPSNLVDAQGIRHIREVTGAARKEIDALRRAALLPGPDGIDAF